MWSGLNKLVKNPAKADVVKMSVLVKKCCKHYSNNRHTVGTLGKAWWISLTICSGLCLQTLSKVTESAHGRHHIPMGNERQCQHSCTGCQCYGRYGNRTNDAQTSKHTIEYHFRHHRLMWEVTKVLPVQSLLSTPCCCSRSSAVAQDQQPKISWGHQHQ